MGKSQSDYARGYQDGAKHAEADKRDGVLGVLTDHFLIDPLYDDKGSAEYKEGHKDGRKDGWEKIEKR